MFVSFGFGPGFGGASNGATHIVEAIAGIADITPKAATVPMGLVGIVKQQKIKGVLSKEDIAKITGNKIKGAVT